MKHFYKVADFVTAPLLHAVRRHPELWDQNTLRTTHPGTAHADVSDIWLWFNPQEGGDIANGIQTMPYPAWFLLPQARGIIFDLMRIVEASQLGRVIITRLPPGKTITPHEDAGAPVEFYKRYQVALQSAPGIMFQIEDECVNFQDGEVWLIDNKAKHSVTNNSKTDRISMVVDLRPA